MEFSAGDRLTNKDLRRFGLTLGPVFVALGTLAAVRGKAAWAATLIVGAGLLITGALLAPQLLRPIHGGWMRIAEALSRITTPVVMFVLYFGVITPMGLLSRLAGHRPLSHGDAAKGHWVKRERGRSDLHRQF